MDVNGAIVADTLYVASELTARDVTMTLPEITPQTADVEAMGVMSLPIWQRLEDMETSINKIGIDLGFRNMIGGDKLPIEARFVQQTVTPNGTTKNVGCKAFLSCIPKSIPGLEITPGEALENEITFATTRYQLFADGVEMFLIDRIAGICRINGVDYTKNMSKYL